ncbi:hypothetical protein LguiB_017649 [Lonicera macranthoides]
MELELGLKITKAVNDCTSASLNISKDIGGPLFVSRETDTMFILSAHLKGYKKENVKIDISEDGTKITIRGERPVQEMVMVGWKVVKKGIEMRGFRKSFIIPNGIVLDKIKAKFNADESTLTISIPKLEKGEISGVELEEIEEDDVLKGDSQPSKVGTDETNERKISTQEDRESEVEEVKEIQTVEKLSEGNQSNETKEKIQEKEVCHSKEEKGTQEVEKERYFDIGSPKRVEENSPRGRSKLCVPIVVGSALIVSFIVFVFHCIRTKNQSRRRN